MDELTKIVGSSTPSRAVQYRKGAYGKAGIRDFLRDLMAIANASVNGKRFIVVGAEADDAGRLHFRPVDADDFSTQPAYHAVASEYIEPPIRLDYAPVDLDGTRIGVFEIGDCQNRPYMMRIDHSETLRRGDAYVRVNDTAVKMGRRQLQVLFEKKFRESVSAANVEIGFPGDIIHKDTHVATCDVSKLPSRIAGKKIQQLIDIKKDSKSTGSTSMVARLTHARLFGSDTPYEDRSPEELIAELHQINSRYRAHDEHYLFEQNRQDIQVVVTNQGEEPIEDATLTVILPAHEALFVASRLPMIREEGEFVERYDDEQDGYPNVGITDKAINIAAQLGDIAPGAPVAAFQSPLRICAGRELAGRKVAMRYSLFAPNLSKPVTGRLRLLIDE